MDYFNAEEEDADAEFLSYTMNITDVEDEEEDEDEYDEGGEEDDDNGTTAVLQVLYGNQDNGLNSATVSSSNEVINFMRDGTTVDDEPESNSQRRNISDGKLREAASLEGGDNGREIFELSDFGRGEIDGLFCPICLEAWSSGGDHHVCCLPCGHIYGLSCIQKWLRRRGSSKCPQCKKKCTTKDIRLLYATQIVAVDEGLQKKVQSLEAKCVYLEKKNAEWSKKETEWKKREGDLCNKVQDLKAKKNKLEAILEARERSTSGLFASSLNYQGEPGLGIDNSSIFSMHPCSNKFRMQNEFQVDGARLFDIDASSQILLIARRLQRMGGTHVLTKMSLLSDQEKEDILLPLNTKVVKDLKVSPHGKLVLLASLGKKLSVLSTESNNMILTYDLPAAAWSCSWDICNPHYLYAGLQNGTVLQFDTRQTMRCVDSLTSLTGNPIHTVHSLSHDSSLGSGVRSVLTASSHGLCRWNFGGSDVQPYLIPESEKQGVCISAAYCLNSDEIVASYRPKIEISGDLEITQPTAASAFLPSGHSVKGSHVLYRKLGSTHQKVATTCANVSDIRLPKSAIIDGVSKYPVFVSVDEAASELVLHELPSLLVTEHLKSQKYPVRDIKCSNVSSSGLLGCLSENTLQLFTAGPF